MSTRTRLAPETVLSAGDMSATSVSTKSTVLNSLTCLSYEVTWAGATPIGTLTLEVSNSYALNPAGGVATTGTWTTVPMDVGGAYATSIPITGNTGNGFIDVTLQAGYAARLTYTKSSGTGAINAVIAGKVA